MARNPVIVAESRDRKWKIEKGFYGPGASEFYVVREHGKAVGSFKTLKAAKSYIRHEADAYAVFSNPVDGEIGSISGRYAVVRRSRGDKPPYNIGRNMYVVTKDGEIIPHSGSFPTSYDAIEYMMKRVYRDKGKVYSNPKYAPREAVHVQGLEGPYRYSGAAGSRGGFLGIGSTKLVQVVPVGGGDSIIVPEAAVRALTKNPPKCANCGKTCKKVFTVNGVPYCSVSHASKALGIRNPVVSGEVGMIPGVGRVRVTGRAPSKGGTFGFGGQDMVYVEGDVPGGYGEVPRASVHPLPVHNPVYQCPVCNNALPHRTGNHRCRYCGAGVRIKK